MTATLFDPVASRQARDEGIAKVLSHNEQWKRDVREFIEMLPFAWKGSSEDIRRLWGECGGANPNHPNAWGGVMGAMQRNGYLDAIGFTQCKAKQSHARKCPLYQRTSKGMMAKP